VWPEPEETVEHSYNITQPDGSFALGEIIAWFPVGKAVEWHVNIVASHHMMVGQVA
jgi:hypothetical protein